MPDGVMGNMEQARLQVTGYFQQLVQLAVSNRPRSLLGWAVWVAMGLAGGTCALAITAGLAFLSAAAAVVMLTAIPVTGFVFSAMLAGAACFSCILTACALAMLCSLWTCDLGSRLCLYVLQLLLPDVHAWLLHHLQTLDMSLLLSILKQYLLPVAHDATQQAHQAGAFYNLQGPSAAAYQAGEHRACDSTADGHSSPCQPPRSKQHACDSQPDEGALMLGAGKLARDEEQVPRLGLKAVVNNSVVYGGEQVDDRAAGDVAVVATALQQGPCTQSQQATAAATANINVACAPAVHAACVQATVQG